MATKWTADQKKAIDIRGKDVLVSAAAGSGKTAALTERVLRILTDTTDPCSIDELLIVTFTRASAAELKERIRKKLSESLSKDPKNSHIRRQLAALPSAKISTVHSFCGSLVKENSVELSLPSGMKIGDAMESDLLFRHTLEQTLHDAYEKESPFNDGFDFEHISDNFLRSKTDNALTDMLSDIYKKALNSPKKLDLILQSAEYHREICENGFENSIYFTSILRIINYHFEYFRSKLLQVLEQYGEDEDFVKACFKPLSSDLEFANSVLSAANDRSYSKLKYTLNSRSFLRMGSVKGSPDFKKTSTELHSLIKKESEKLNEYFGFTSEELTEYSAECADILCGVHRFLSVVDERFTKAKISKKMLDYSDLEHYAYRLLHDKDTNEPTPLARKISSELREVMVDEYQDTNELQDGIFSAVGAGKRFMVGDIKQSIYSFRGAVPQLFSDYRVKFSGDDENEETLFFSNNFRCSKPVVELTNNIFSALFPLNSDILYQKRDELVFSKSEDLSSEEDDASIILLNESTEYDSEAVWVAEKISYLLKNGRNEIGQPYKPGDFAIMLRGIKSAEGYINELNARGIPANSSEDGNLFESPEIQLLISLLNVIDNPANDIYLAAVMKSPFFAFTLDELVDLRNSSEEPTLYNTVKNASVHGNEKCRKMLDALSRYRYISRSMAADKFISFLYKDLCVMERICAADHSKHCEIKKSNLHLLYEYARKFENGSFKGLYNFISYLNDMIDSEKALPEAKLPEKSLGGVQIMTIHRSKGLEFPVCFICECGKRLINTDTGSINYSRKHLFAIKHKAKNGLVIHKLPTHALINADNREAEFFDELRVLYVALTRARQKLFICGKAKDAQKFLDDNLNDEIADTYTLRNSSSSMALFLRSLTYRTCPVKVCTIDTSTADLNDIPLIETQFTIDEKLKNELRERLSFVYPHKAITQIPKKVSVSKLYPGILNGDEQFSSHIEIHSDISPFVMPELDTAENIATKRGIATHAFMQFCDMANAGDDIDRECKRLISKGFIPESFEELLYKKELEIFFAGDLYRSISSAKNVWREYRFNIGFSADLFTDSENIPSDEKLYVQGVIDCFFEETDGTITVVDYKTDRIYEKDPTSVTEFVNRHKDQLKYYALAIEQITNKKVLKKLLYSFSLGKSIQV